MKLKQRSGTEADRERSIVECLPDAVVITTLDGTIRYANPAAEHLFGRYASDLVGTSISFPVRLGGISEIELQRPGGRMLPAELRVGETEWAGERVRVLTLRDATDRKRAEERAAQLDRERVARAEAEAASEAKSEFLAIMSHELRTPINAVIGYADLLHLGVAGPLTKDQQVKVTRILDSARHLLGLVNEVLDLSRVDANTLTVQRRAVLRAKVVDAALAVMQPDADARGVQMHSNCVDQTAAFLGDADRTRQILVHLLDNAIKFTQPGGRILVDCCDGLTPGPGVQLGDFSHWLCVRVVDTGVGIPPDRLASIFDPFVQVEGGHTRSSDGTGLGLTVSRRLARLMGGDLTVESELGKGSTFTLWLPAASEEQRGAADWQFAHAPIQPLDGLCEIGAVLTRATPAIIHAITDRIRAEQLLPGARSLRGAQLADHLGAYIVDLAGTLAAIEEMRGEPSRLLTDGADIQQLVADRHGAQRADLGCTLVNLRREWDIIGEEMTKVIRGVPVGDAAIAEALNVLERFLESGRTTSERALLRSHPRS